MPPVVLSAIAAASDQEVELKVFVLPLGVNAESPYAMLPSTSKVDLEAAYSRQLGHVAANMVAGPLSKRPGACPKRWLYGPFVRESLLPIESFTLIDSCQESSQSLGFEAVDRVELTW